MCEWVSVVHPCVVAIVDASEVLVRGPTVEISDTGAADSPVSVLSDITREFIGTRRVSVTMLPIVAPTTRLAAY